MQTLLCDTCGVHPVLMKEELTESAVQGMAHKRVYKMSGIYQIADETNQNGRIYPYNTLKESINRTKDSVKSRGMLGELDHPDSARINLNNVSHVVTKLWMEGKVVYGESEILPDFPSGAILAALLKYNLKVGISSRGMGDMDTISESNKTYNVVLPGYTILTFDVVQDPSVKSAVQRLTENYNRNVVTKIKSRKKDKNLFLVDAVDKWLKNI